MKIDKRVRVRSEVRIMKNKVGTLTSFPVKFASAAEEAIFKARMEAAVLSVIADTVKNGVFKKGA